MRLALQRAARCAHTLRIATTQGVDHACDVAEALPNLINPFRMLPPLGVLGLKARHIVGFTFLQFIVHVPMVLLLLWTLGGTFAYHAPVMPATP